ncbi:hypothetical protein QR680_016058 [Steinernema hermaphroditum]|uniref:C-type lectin domain-containing protein n=1 Tax=Steinernema hermaphroditum TaxID=289476 RepID=A0AA39HA61_9BILA|nr:hypothetical protein QR680_016058 [Steinernema hermaphroditum]
MKSFFVFSALVAVASAACPDGWALFPKTNSCYRHYFEKKNYDDAKAACVAEGAALVTITSVDENEFVQVISTMDEDQRWNGQPWIGAYTDAPDGLPTSSFQWKWVDGQPWGYTNWCPENPDHNWEKCVQLLSDNCPICNQQFRMGCWNNNGCHYAHPYVCKRPNPA